MTEMKKSFQDCYLKVCEDKNITSPIKCLSFQKDPSKISINADRVKLHEWEAIFSVLQIENCLKKIHIYSKRHKRDWPNCVMDEVKTSLMTSSIRGPVIFTRYILEKLINSLTKSLSREKSLCEELIIELPLSPEYCLALSKGLQGSSNLKSISLAGSCIGDEGCVYLCDAIKSLSSMREINLTECNLGVAATISLAKLIRTHSLMRATVAWESSFRYRCPMTTVPSGIVRITMNKNPGIGNKGAVNLAEALIDDAWIKAIDLQRCNISNEGGMKLLNVLSANSTICVIDIRGNRAVSKYIQDQMQKTLQCASRDETIQWLPYSPAKNSASKQHGTQGK